MKPFFEKGSTVLFTGDSITDCNRSREDFYDLGNGYGYPSKFAIMYQTLFSNQNVTFLNRGVSGDTTTLLLERYEVDLKELKPDFVSILIGINDTWRGFDQGLYTSPEQLEKNYREFLSNIKKDLKKTKILMIEPFMLDGGIEKAEFRSDLNPKIEKVRLLAREFADYYIALDGIFYQYGTTVMDLKELSDDGVHPTDLGHSIITESILKTLEII